MTISIDPVSGTVVNELQDIRNSVADILRTPVGTRVMRRGYGSHIFDLVDSPGSQAWSLSIIAAAAEAITRWEPRVRVVSGNVVVHANGSAEIRTVLSVRASNLNIAAHTVLGGVR